MLLINFDEVDDDVRALLPDATKPFEYGHGLAATLSHKCLKHAHTRHIRTLARTHFSRSHPLPCQCACCLLSLRACRCKAFSSRSSPFVLARRNFAPDLSVVAGKPVAAKAVPPPLRQDMLAAAGMRA